MGAHDGTNVGDAVGDAVGSFDGRAVGDADGDAVKVFSHVFSSFSPFAPSLWQPFTLNRKRTCVPPTRPSVPSSPVAEHAPHFPYSPQHASEQTSHFFVSVCSWSGGHDRFGLRRDRDVSPSLPQSCEHGDHASNSPHSHAVGAFVGDVDGDAVGAPDGRVVGDSVGDGLGRRLGWPVGPSFLLMDLRSIRGHAFFLVTQVLTILQHVCQVLRSTCTDCHFLKEIAFVYNRISNRKCDGIVVLDFLS